MDYLLLDVGSINKVGKEQLIKKQHESTKKMKNKKAT